MLIQVLTLNSNDEINQLKKQIVQKDSEIDNYRNKLAVMNRQIIVYIFLKINNYIIIKEFIKLIKNFLIN